MRFRLFQLVFSSIYLHKARWMPITHMSGSPDFIFPNKKQDCINSCIICKTSFPFIRSLIRCLPNNCFNFLYRHLMHFADFYHCFFCVHPFVHKVRKMFKDYHIQNFFIAFSEAFFTALSSQSCKCSCFNCTLFTISKNIF